MSMRVSVLFTSHQALRGSYSLLYPSPAASDFWRYHEHACNSDSWLDGMIEEALDSLEHAIALSEARQEVPADNVTKRVAELYRRIQRTHSRCQRLSIGASEIRSTCDSEASGVLQSISLTDDLTISKLRESELVKEGVHPPLPGLQTAWRSTAISARASRPSAGAESISSQCGQQRSVRPTPAPAADSDDDSDGDLVAPTYARMLAPNRLGPMASERSRPAYL